jgi:hypothetical protein
MKFYKKLKLNKNSPKSLELTYLKDGQIIMDIPYEKDPNDPTDTRPSTMPILRALRIPTGTGDPQANAGTAANERPREDDWYDTNGLIRYNTTLEALEVLTNGIWVQLRAKEPAKITVQRFGARPLDIPNLEAGEETYQENEAIGFETEIDVDHVSFVDGEEIYFGPIRDRFAKNPFSAANIFVYVENVFQIPFTNYIIVDVDDIVGASKSYPSPGKYLKFESPPPLGKTVTVIHGFD